MEYTVAWIADMVGGEVHGDGSVVVTGVAGLEKAGDGDIAFAEGRNLAHASESMASAIIVPQAQPDFPRAQIVVEQPYPAFARILALVAEERADLPQDIHPTVVVGPAATLGDGVAMGPSAVIGPRTVVGARSKICAHVFIGADCRLGADCLIYPNVTIRERTAIGDRVIIHPGTTIGGDGFGYIQHEGHHVKVPQVGAVEIGDDCEIGCNCTIDRATMDKTILGRRVKVDNHSHIAHNCIIGDDCILVAYARIGGGTVLENGVTLAEDVGVTDHVRLGEGCIVAGSSKVSKSIAAGAVVWGFPAQNIRREKIERASLRRLPDLFGRVKAIEKRLAED